MAGTRMRMMLLCLRRHRRQQSLSPLLPVSGALTETELPIEPSLRHGAQQGHCSL